MIPQFEPLVMVEVAEAVKQQMISGWVGPGKMVTKFENQVADFVGSPHAIACTSGSTALLIALLALGIEPGSTVAVPAYSFIAATNAVRFLGLKPYLVDIKPDTLCMDPIQLKKAISSTKISACIFIDHNGYIGEDLRFVRKICDVNHIPMIEDAACALGQRVDYEEFVPGVPEASPFVREYHAGTIGDIGTFSFSVPKIITTGQGGMLVTRRYELAQRCREIIDQGSTTWRRDGLHVNTGLNFKFNDILATYGSEQMNRIDTLLNIRFKLYTWYKNNGIDLFFPHYSPWATVAGARPSPWMMVLISDKAKAIQENLANNKIQSRFLYKPIRHSVPSNHCTPVVDALHEKILYLPSSLTLLESQVNFISEKILEVI